MKMSSATYSVSIHNLLFSGYIPTMQMVFILILKKETDTQNHTLQYSLQNPLNETLLDLGGPLSKL